MTVMAAYPITPTVTPLRGTLLDVASVSDDFAWHDGVGLFDSYNCMKFQAEAEFCAPNVKTFDNDIGWQNGFRFAAYGGAVCKAVGLDESRMLSEVRRVFTDGESTAVERALMSTRFAADALWDTPTDITPAGGAVAPGVGIALLEGHAADNYVGAPTLHIPRVIASLLTSREMLQFKGDALATKLGSKVAAGGGYDYPNLGPTGAAAAAGERWLYATGEVVLIRSEPVVHQMMAYDTNEVFVLAERAYILAIDCYSAAVRVTVTA